MNCEAHSGCLHAHLPLPADKGLGGGVELGLPEAGVSRTGIFVLQPFGDQILADLGGLKRPMPQPSPNAHAPGTPILVADAREGSGSLASPLRRQVWGLPGGSGVQAGAVLALGQGS